MRIWMKKWAQRRDQLGASETLCKNYKSEVNFNTIIYVKK